MRFDSLLHRFTKGAVAVVVMLACGCSLYPPGPVTQRYYAYDMSCSSFFAAEAKRRVANECQAGFGELEKSISCAETTRDTYGGFLLCREKEQLAAGGAIALLAAGAAGVAAAGVSATAAASLGAAAGAGLATDIALYNKVKSQAYANGIVRLQCVVDDAAPVRGKLADLRKLDPGIAEIGLQVSDPNACTPSDDAEKAERNLVAAKYEIARRRVQYAEGRLSAMPPQMVLAVDTVDARAFAAAQAGVPDPGQIESAVKAVGVALPGVGTKAAAVKPKGLTAESLTAPAPTATTAPSCRPFIRITEAATAQLNKALEGVQLPDPKFGECLSITAEKASADQTSAAKSDSSSKTLSKKGNSTSSKSASDDKSADDSSGGGGDGSTPAQKPDKLAFQVLPSDEATMKDDQNPARIKLVGGTPPYYAIPVDDGAIDLVSASQTDLFVSFEVSAHETRSRLLVADQAGALELVYVNPAKKAPAGGSTGQTGRTRRGPARLPRRRQKP